MNKKKEEKKNIVKMVMVCVAAFLIVLLILLSCVVPYASWKYYFCQPKIDKRKAGELRIHFLDVGQGDCTLIELPDGKVMLIDGGDDKSSTKKGIMRYLNALNKKTIDYLVVTHTDGDHCGGLEEVFRYKKVRAAYLPQAYDETDTEYAEMYAAAVEENCPMVPLSREVNLSNAEMPYTLSVLYPYSTEATKEYSEDSAVLFLDYMGVSALFCGDADERVEKILLRDDLLGLYAPRGISLADTEILKVAHHGSGSSTSQALLDRLRPKTAVISCGKENVYGHPSKETMLRLEGCGAEIYRTDRQGHIVATIKADGSYFIKTVK